MPLLTKTTVEKKKSGKGLQSRALLLTAKLLIVFLQILPTFHLISS